MGGQQEGGARPGVGVGCGRVMRGRRFTRRGTRGRAGCQLVAQNDTLRAGVRSPLKSNQVSPGAPHPSSPAARRQPARPPPPHLVAADVACDAQALAPLAPCEPAPPHPSAHARAHTHLVAADVAGDAQALAPLLLDERLRLGRVLGGGQGVGASGGGRGRGWRAGVLVIRRRSPPRRSGMQRGGRGTSAARFKHTHSLAPPAPPSPAPPPTFSSAGRYTIATSAPSRAKWTACGARVWAGSV